MQFIGALRQYLCDFWCITSILDAIFGALRQYLMHHMLNHTISYDVLLYDANMHIKYIGYIEYAYHEWCI